MPKTSLMLGTKMTKILMKVRRKPIIPKCFAHEKSCSGNRRKVSAFLACKTLADTLLSLGAKSLFTDDLQRKDQGRTEVRWRTGQETGLAPPCSNLRSFGSKCTVLKKLHATCWDFSAAPMIRPPGIVPLCPHSVRP